ncbi:MAG: nucleotidyltransferase domain-containing protein [Planctomycetes bacterium]|nr:nucleotidyltransferase domain-containing protein [Planctomycetota bacterium]
MQPILAADPEVAVAWLFGSAARGTMRPDSDVDVAILFREGLAEAAREERLADLASRLAASCSPRELELVDLAAQGPVFVHRALVDGKRIVVNDDERRGTFEGESHVRYLDWKPTWDLAAREQQAGMRRWLARQWRA